MSRLAVFGATGMLGSVVIEQASEEGWTTLNPLRSVFSIDDRDDVATFCEVYKPDAIINCAGRIPGKGDDVEMVRANALGPQILADTCRPRGIKLLHVSTDCVYKGDITPGRAYTVADKPNAEDAYGRSKAEGEHLVPPTPSLNQDVITVVRTSFIGFDHGLLRWLLDQARAGARTLPGWANAWWSGSSVYEVSRYLLGLLSSGALPPIIHLSCSTPTTKYKALEELVHAFDLDIEIEPQDEPKINRALTPTHPLRSIHHPQILNELVAKAYQWTPSRS